MLPQCRDECSVGGMDLNDELLPRASRYDDGGNKPDPEPGYWYTFTAEGECLKLDGADNHVTQV